MKRTIRFFLALGILSGILPTTARSQSSPGVTPVFWPRYFFVDPAGPNPNSVALFQLTGLTPNKSVTVTMKLTSGLSVVQEVLDGDSQLVFTPTVSEGVLCVVRTLPVGTSTKVYTETVTIKQGWDKVSLSQSTTVKSTKDPDTAVLEIVKEQAPATKPLARPYAYSRCKAMAEGSDVSSGESEVDGKIVVRFYTLAGVPLKIWLQNEDIPVFTPFSPSGDFKTSFFTNIFKGILGAGTTVISTLGKLISWVGAILSTTVNKTLGGLLALVALPNPSSGMTHVAFNVARVPPSPDLASGPGAQKPVSPGFEYVNLTVYNLQGQRVKTLIDGERAVGRYQADWDGRDEMGRQVANGMYFYRLRAGGQYAVGKSLILR
jgi:hypothetical protein